MRLFTAVAIFLATSVPALAAHRHHYHQHAAHLHHVARAHASISAAAGFGIVTVPSAAGSITVAGHLAPRWQALIADFVAAGYRPRRIGCFARGGHVPNSRHYAGAACDFDQRGWGLTVPFMYRAHAIILRHGFRDGCSFNDCGHVDDGLAGRQVRRARRAGSR